jgi:hypothetical protein
MRFLQQGDSSALLGWDFGSLPAVWVLDPPSALADTNLSAFIWSVADLLRGDYKQSDYGKVILPFTVLRRLDCVPEQISQVTTIGSKETPGVPLVSQVQRLRSITCLAPQVVLVEVIQ